MSTRYLLHRVRTEPLQWQTVADGLIDAGAASFGAAGGALYGVWRSQIGRPRDEVNAITTWSAARGETVMDRWFENNAQVREHHTRAMTPTLRPASSAPPRRQGNYAFRYFETPAANYDEFLQLCAAGWPGFEAAYDSQVIGLWRFDDGAGDAVETLLLTRRPDLAMWERSKLPAGAAEAEVRRTLSRRYDLCTDTVVYTSTLLSAADTRDTARWA